MKRVIALILCLALVLAIMPSALAADDKAELQPLINAGGTVTLDSGRVYTIESALQVASDVTVVLNGATIKSKGDVFEVTSGTLTVNGDGTVEAGINNDGTWCAVWGNGGNVIINGGSYTTGADANGLGNDTIYAKNGSTITINGGEFSSKALSNSFAQPQYSCLNEKDGNGTIIVKGGTFNGFNPSDNYSENPRKDFVADGYHVEANGDVYTVVPDQPVPSTPVEQPVYPWFITYTEPTVVTVKDGESVKLNAFAVYASAYQWQVLTETGWQNIDNGAVANFVSAPVTYADNGAQLRCIAINQYGYAVSQVITLNVLPSVDMEIELPQTGDSSMTLAWAGLALVACIACVTIRRKVK